MTIIDFVFWYVFPCMKAISMIVGTWNHEIDQNIKKQRNCSATAIELSDNKCAIVSPNN